MKINELHHIVKVNGNRQQSENLQRMAFSIGIYWRGSFGLLDVLIKNEKYLVFANGEITYSKFDNCAIVNDYKEVSYRQMMSIMKQIKFNSEIKTDNIIIIPDCYNSISKQDIKTIHEKLNNSQATKIVELQDEIDKLHLQLSQFENEESKRVEHEIDYKTMFEKQLELNEKLTSVNNTQAIKIDELQVGDDSAICENVKLNERVTHLKMHLEHNKKRRQELKIDYNNLYSENTKLHNTIETINKQLNVLRLTNVKMYDMNNNQAIKIAELTERLTTDEIDYKSKIVELQDEIDKSNSGNTSTLFIGMKWQIDKLLHQVDILKIANDNLTEKCNNFERRINAMNGKHCKCCKSTITTIDTDFEVEETENEKQLKQAMDTLNNQIVKLSIKNNKQTVIINNLTKQIEQRNSNLNNITEKLDKLKHRISNLKSINNILKNTIHRLQDDNSKLTEKLDGNIIMISGLNYRINQLIRDIVGLEADKSSLNAQVEQYIKIDIARNNINTRQFYHICPQCKLKGFINPENLRAVVE